MRWRKWRLFAFVAITLMLFPYAVRALNNHLAEVDATVIITGSLADTAEPKKIVAPVITDCTIEVDGVLDDAHWGQAVTRNDFTFPWRDNPAPRTVFRTLMDATHFYFAFEADDADIVIDKTWTGKATVGGEDRVELFFAGQRRLEEYYCLEIDPLARVMDFRAQYHHQFDLSWSCPGLDVAASINDTGYVVEGRIPLATLRAMQPFNEGDQDRFLFGLYRAEFSHKADGTVDEAWISWKQPDSETPDFHIPSSFGALLTSK
jgi:hypothetical protein